MRQPGHKPGPDCRKKEGNETMAYCSSTGHFAGLDEPEVEIESESASGAELSFDVRVVRPCVECGDDSASYDTTLEETVEHKCKVEEGAEEDDEEEEPEFDIISSDAECSEYMQTHTRHGKLIPAGASSRYRKRLFMVTVTANLQCTKCDEEFEVTLEERDIPASAFPAESH